MKPSAHDEGFTLVEVLMAMIVLGIGVAALMTAMGTHVKISAANRNQAAASSLLTTASEYAKSYTWNPTKVSGTCAALSGATLAASGPTPPAGFTVTYSDGQAVTSASPCELQRVRVEVQGLGYDLTVDVAKRANTETTP